MAKRTIGAGERERRKRLVAAWRRSGQSAAEFGERRGISQWTLYAWAKHVGAGPNRSRQKRRPVRSSPTAGVAGFVPVRLVGDVGRIRFSRGTYRSHSTRLWSRDSFGRLVLAILLAQGYS